MTNNNDKPTQTANEGDWLEVHEVHGQGFRHGQILEVLGEGQHARFRVRWDENHESIVYPNDGVRIIPASQRVPRHLSASKDS